MSNDILIAGAGIGGLTTALSLHAAGFQVQVFESVAQILPLGVGINLLPHAFRELDELGLGERLSSSGVACRELAYYTKRGEKIWAEARGKAAGYRWPRYRFTEVYCNRSYWKPSLNALEVKDCTWECILPTSWIPRMAYK